VGLQTRLEPVMDTLNTVATLNGCTGALASRSPAGAEVRVFTSTCPRTGTVALVTIRDMQHQWTESATTYGIDETRYSTTWLFEHTTA
jgi:poly(3-hydroxybutyrate) depolymerase